MARGTLFLALASAMIVAAAASPVASRKMLQTVDVAAPLTAVSVNVANLQSSLQSVLPLRSVAPAATAKAAVSTKATAAPLAFGKGKLDLSAIKTEVKAVKAALKTEVKAIKSEVKAIKAEVTGKAEELIALPTKVAKSLPLGKGRKLAGASPLEALQASLPKLGKGKAAVPSIETVKAELKTKLESLVPKGKGALPTLKAAPAVPLALPTIKVAPVALPTIKVAPVALPTLKTTPLALPTIKTTPLALPTLKAAPVQKASTSVKAAGASVTAAVQSAAKSAQSAATSVGVQVANLVGVKVNA